MVASWTERFLPKIAPANATGCCLWMAAKDKHGYGKFYLGGRARRAHQAAWVMKTGHFPERGMEVMHTCDEPACVNPDHLVLGAHADNMADMARKRRSGEKRGESNPFAKLTAEKVRQIRASTEADKVIATAFGVCDRTVHDIRRGRCWTHV